MSEPGFHRSNVPSQGMTRRTALTGTTAIALIPAANITRSGNPRGPVSPSDFLPTGVTSPTHATPAQTTAAIQAAIDSGAGDIYLSAGVWVVEPPVHEALPGTFGASSVCIDLRSNLFLHGPGILRLAAGKGGPSGAILGNRNGLAIENVRIECSIDGNQVHAAGKMSGIVLVNATNCIVRNIFVKNTSFNGVQFAKQSLACIIENVTLNNIGYIGVQLQGANQAKVLKNSFYLIGDNAIDFESNNEESDLNVIIQNSGSGCSTFIFMESGGNTIIRDNSAADIREAGIWLNRINSGSEHNLIVANRLRRGTGAGRRGAIYVNNSSGRSLVSGNHIDGFDCGLILEGSSTHLAIESNYFRNIAKVLYKISPMESALVKSVVKQSYYEGPLNGHFPLTCSPLKNRQNSPNRTFNVIVESMWNLDEGAARAGMPDEEYRTGTTGQLQRYARWNGAYAEFNAGDTWVYAPEAALTLGRYIVIDDTTLIIHSKREAGVWMLRNAMGNQSDLTGILNSSHVFHEYWPEWQSG